MGTKPTVAASYARTLIDFAASQGADPGVLTARSAIAPEELFDPDSRLPLAKLKALMAAAKELCDDPAFALHFAESPALYETTVLGLIIRSVETVGETFAQFGRYARLVMEVDAGDSGDRFTLVRDGTDCRLEDRRKNPNDFPEITEATFARITCECARTFPDRPFAKAVHVTHAAPAYVAEYERILRAPVIFGSDRNAMSFDASWLATRLPTANRYSLGIFNAYAQSLLDELDSTGTIRTEIERLLIPVLHKGDIGMEMIAGKMQMSAPTLYRKLKEEGISYRTLLDDLRCKIALDYLTTRKTSVNETAYLVGFSDLASFSRAFKRWTGMSPRAARENGRREL